MIKMLQYKMYPADKLRCPTTALVITSTLDKAKFVGEGRNSYIFIPPKHMLIPFGIALSR